MSSNLQPINIYLGQEKHDISILFGNIEIKFKFVGLAIRWEMYPLYRRINLIIIITFDKY